MKEDKEMINCSATVMPIYFDEENEELKIGFLRRSLDDESFSGMLVAPGGKVKEQDGELLDGVPYFSVECACIRELMEEASMEIERHDLFYLCSLTLPNGRVVISYYILVSELAETLEWFNKKDIEKRQDFAPGMKQEALLALETV